jgi:hypothetical protein
MDTSTQGRIESELTLRDGPHCAGAGSESAAVYARHSDETLVLRTRTGENAAFGELVRRHQDGLYALALNSLPDVQAAGDALCEIVVAAFRDVGSPKALRSPAGWLRLHGFRVVFMRLNPSPGRYTIVRWPWPVATSSAID